MSVAIHITGRGLSRGYGESTLHRIEHDFPGLTVARTRRGKVRLDGDKRGLHINIAHGTSRASVIQTGDVRGGIDL